ncbi:YfcE family phosphodiesterase [bacterium]|nr:YfcE family phosphodiesterase [bacterium]
MTYFLFSDIHSNFPALEAFLEIADREKPDAVYCLGDLVGYNIWPNEVADHIRSRRIPCIAGNYDEGIGLHSDDCGCAYKSDEEQANGAVSIRLTNEWVTEETRRYLRSLPRHLRLDLHNGPESPNLLLVHGSPRKINEYLFEDRPDKSLLRILHDAQTDALFFGHTHQPYHRILEDHYEDGRVRYRHAVNIGSVGKPKDGDPRGCFVRVRYDGVPRFDTLDGFKVDFVRFEYDVERAAKAVEYSELPDAYAEALRKGR